MIKYFFLFVSTLMIHAFSGLNTFGQPNKSAAETEGSWTAHIKNGEISIEFKKDSRPNSTDSSSFNLSEFRALPREKNGGFTLTREAGIILLNGKFEGNEGSGRYKFMPNKEYVDYMHSHELKELDDEDLFAFFLVNVTKAYVKIFQDNGYRITKNELIPLAALKVDEAYIRFWKENGYKNISASDLIPLKALNISADYVKNFQSLGYNNISTSDMIPMKSLEITANYLKGFQDLGFRNIPPSELIPLKSAGVTADYVKKFQDMGFTNIDLNEMISLKSTGVTSDFVLAMKKKGFEYKSLNKYMQLKNLQD